MFTYGVLLKDSPAGGGITVIKKSTYFVLIQMLFVLATYSLASCSESYVKLYPLPFTELKTVVLDWFLDSDFEVRYTNPERGLVDITALKGHEHWQISLIAHSPLAAKIWVKIENGGRPDLLWNHIFQYLRGLSSQSKTERNHASTPSSVLARVESVVCIKTSESEQSIQFTGFFISREGVILCTAHDLMDHSRVTVMLNDGREIEGQVVKLDAHRDLAIVLVKARLNPFIELGNSHHPLEENERLFSVGCPLNVLGIIHAGSLYGAPRRLNGSPLWHVEMVMHPGSSGSPVFDAAGNLVAMIKGRHRGTDSLGFMIPFEILLDFVKENGIL